MQGYKIDISDYEYLTGDVVDGTRKKEKEEMRFSLGFLLTNPNIGASNGQGPEGFDLEAYYKLARKIEQEKSTCITLDSKDYEILKKRVKQLAGQAGYKYGEMVVRVMDAQEVKLGEVCEDGSTT